MSNKPHNRPRKQLAAPATSSSRRPRSGQDGTGRGVSRNTIVIVAAAMVATIVAAVIIAIVVRDDEATAEPGGVADCSAVDVPGETPAPAEPADFDDGGAFQPVAIGGEALTVFDDAIRSGQVADTAICAAAPVVSGYGYDGTEVTVDAATDGATLVVLLAHWCPHCNAEIPELNDWRDSGGVPDDLNVVGVSTSVEPDADNYPPDEWLDSRDWQWPVLADDAGRTAFAAYGGNNFPTMLLIDDDGLVVWRHAGRIAIDDLQAIVDAL